MIVYGAGLAGLLAANILRRHKPEVREAQASLPNNHEALLRFRTSAVSDATGIPFKRVRVLKGIYFHGQLHTTPNLLFSNLYSQKVSGSVAGRSIMNLEPVDRYIAPPDLIAQLARGCDITYSSPLQGIAGSAEMPIISTIPMPAILKMASYHDSELEFKYSTITSLTADIKGVNVDVYQTIYYPGAEPYYRASITGNRLIVEFCKQADLEENISGAHVLRTILRDNFGIGGTFTLQNIQMKEQKYGKILPVADAPRKRAIMFLTNGLNIYSVGRFATWRQILMDDVVGDVKTIEQFIRSGTYARALHYKAE